MNNVIDELREKAIQGNSWAQFNLGVMYDKGEGVTQDYKEAIKWYTLSANQGYVEAQSALKVIYNKGNGINQRCKQTDLKDNDRSYPALKVISGIFDFVGFLFLLVFLVSLAFLLIGQDLFGSIISIPVILCSIFFSILSFACAEIIKVFTDISSYAYRILKHLSNN